VKKDRATPPVRYSEGWGLIRGKPLGRLGKRKCAEEAQGTRAERIKKSQGRGHEVSQGRSGAGRVQRRPAGRGNFMKKVGCGVGWNEKATVEGTQHARVFGWKDKVLNEELGGKNYLQSG